MYDAKSNMGSEIIRVILYITATKTHHRQLNMDHVWQIIICIHFFQWEISLFVSYFFPKSNLIAIFP